MSALAAGLVFVLPLLSGVLLVRLVWAEGGLRYLILEVALGLGAGLGLRSLLYFVYLLIFAGRSWFVGAEVSAFLVLLGLTGIRARSSSFSRGPRLSAPATFRWSHLLVGGVAIVVASVSLLATANYLLRRKQGDWDAWMMYNRSARFIYLDQAHWLESFSPRMDPLFHADYPLLLATNIAAGWQELGHETAAVPMIQSAFFGVGCILLIAGAVGVATTPGQAALAVIVLAGVPVFVNEGARQMADVPLAYYILATGVLIFLSSTRSKRRLLILAGLTAGLGAWTKNEGAVLVLGAVVAVVLATGRRGILRSLEYFGAGLAAPLAVLLYFRLRIAPAGDMLGGSASRLLAQGLDPARHVEILRHFGEVLFGFGSWGMGPVAVGIIPILLAYLALAKAPVGIPEVQAILALTGLLIVQLAGDYAAFLITPYDLAWHLSYSTDRLVLQFFPLFAFMILIMAKPVESLLRFRAGHGSGVQNAAGR